VMALPPRATTAVPVTVPRFLEVVSGLCLGRFVHHTIGS
jgi:hypothetical protein